MAFQMLTRAADVRPPGAAAGVSGRRVMSATGTTMRSSSCLRAPVLTMVTGLKTGGAFRRVLLGRCASAPPR